MAMATSRWSTLPTDILSIISKILNTNVDILRLRSVCSSWRSSVRPRLRPSSFPLKVPRASPAHSTGGHYYLNYTTIYRLSPPEHATAILPMAGCVNPYCFALLSPLVPIEANFASGSITKFLNLLHYLITEICNCYSLTFVDNQGFVTDLLDPKAEKVSVVSNDCDIVLIEFPIPPLPPSSLGSVYYLLEYKSDLYGVFRTIEDFMIDELEDEDCLVGIPPGIPFRSKIFKKCNENWEYIRCLPDEAIISSEDASIVLPLENFKSSKSNCVQVAMRSTVTCSYSGGRVTYYGVYDLAEAGAAFMNREVTTKQMATQKSVNAQCLIAVDVAAAFFEEPGLAGVASGFKVEGIVGKL
ncbi:hypothetical protein V2J09_002049 [Rumex salicifolius]